MGNGGVMSVGCPSDNGIFMNGGRNEDIVSGNFLSNVLYITFFHTDIEQCITNRSFE